MKLSTGNELYWNMRLVKQVSVVFHIRKQTGVSVFTVFQLHQQQTSKQNKRSPEALSADPGERLRHHPPA